MHKFTPKKISQLITLSLMAAGFQNQAFAAVHHINNGQIRDLDTLWDLGSNSELHVGQTTNGTLNIGENGHLRTNILMIGEKAGHGEVNVTNGGKIDITASNYSYPFTVGGEGKSGSTSENSVGTLNISGAGSEVTSSTTIGDSSIGSTGAQGYVNITDGGKLSLSNQLYIGSAGSTATSGQVIINGQNSLLTSTKRVLIGTYNHGLLKVENGGKLTTNEYISVGRVASTLNFDSLLIISGNGSSAQTGSGQYTEVGYAGKGTVVVSDQGKLTSNLIHIARNSGSIGELAIGSRQGQAATAAGIIESNQIQFGLGTGKLVFNHTDPNYQFTPNISGAGTVNIHSGFTTLTGTNTYTGGTNIYAGTLRGSTDSIKGNILNNGTVIFNQLTTATYSNIISGSGSVQKTGNGILTLSGNNTYTGETVVSAGTLKGTTSSIKGNLHNDATVNFEQSTDGIFNGDISGNGSIVKTGNAILTLAGNSTYTGNTLVSAGTLKGDAASLHGNIENNSELWFNQQTDGTYNGQISGTGNLQKDGAGALTLSGMQNQHSLTLNEGMLNIDINSQLTLQSAATLADGTTLGVSIGETPSLIADSITLQNNAVLDITGYTIHTDENTYTLVQTQNGISGHFTYTIAGQALSNHVDPNIFMMGSIKKDSTGNNIIAKFGLVWDHTENASAHGTFHIQDNHSFTLDADLADNTFINAHTFGWDGTTLTKTGRGTLIVDGANTYSGLTDIQEGKLIVGGTEAMNTALISSDVNIANGSTLGGHGQILGHVQLQDGATIAPGNSIGTITVGDITFNNGSIYEFEAHSDGTADKIIATGQATINGGTVKVLANDSVWDTAVLYTILMTKSGLIGEFENVTSNLIFLTPEVIYDNKNAYLTLSRNSVSFDTIAGTFNESQAAKGIESLGNANPVYQIIQSMDAYTARNAYNNLSGEIYASTQGVLLTNSRHIRDGINQHLLTTDVSANRQLWGKTWGYNSRISADGNAEQVKHKDYGILLGIDTQIADHTRIGFAAGYEHSKINIDQTRDSQAKTNAYHAMLYANTKVGSLIDLRAGVGYARLDADTERHIRIPGLTSLNTSTTKGNQWHAYIEGSHTVDLGNGRNLTPYLNLAHTRINMSTSSEQGNATALHHLGSKNELTSTTLGIRGQTTFGNAGQYALYADIGWQHQFGDRSAKSRLAFTGGTPYLVKGATLSKNSALVTVGTELTLKPQFKLKLSYQGTLSSKQKSHGANASLQWIF